MPQPRDLGDVDLKQNTSRHEIKKKPNTSTQRDGTIHSFTIHTSWSYCGQRLFFLVSNLKSQKKTQSSTLPHRTPEITRVAFSNLSNGPFYASFALAFSIPPNDKYTCDFVNGDQYYLHTCVYRPRPRCATTLYPLIAVYPPPPPHHPLLQPPFPPKEKKASLQTQKQKNAAPHKTPQSTGNKTAESSRRTQNKSPYLCSRGIPMNNSPRLAWW